MILEVFSHPSRAPHGDGRHISEASQHPTDLFGQPGRYRAEAGPLKPPGLDASISFPETPYQALDDFDGPGDEFLRKVFVPSFAPEFLIEVLCERLGAAPYATAMSRRVGHSWIRVEDVLHA